MQDDNNVQSWRHLPPAFVYFAEPVVLRPAWETPSGQRLWPPLFPWAIPPQTLAAAGFDDVVPQGAAEVGKGGAGPRRQGRAKSGTLRRDFQGVNW